MKDNFNHYKKAFIELVNKNNEILTNDQIGKYADLFIKKCMNKKRVNALLCQDMSTNFYREKNRWNKEDGLVLRYVKIVGIDDNIVKYFTKKYFYLLTSNKLCVVIKNDFDKIVENALLSLKTTGYNVELLINYEILNYIKDNFCTKKDLDNIRNLNNEKQNKAKKYLEYIKIVVFKKYENDIPYRILKIRLDEKFEDFFYAYLNGTSKLSIILYLNNRLCQNMDTLKSTFDKIKNSNFDLYLEKVNELSKDFIIYYPVEKHLIENYNSVYSEFLNEGRNGFKDNIDNYLKNYFSKLSDVYNENYIKCVSNEYKESNLFDNNEIILYTKYYVEYKLYKQIKFGEFLDNNLRRIRTKKLEGYNAQTRINKLC